MLIVAVGVGTGVGLQLLISRRLGEKRFDEANSAATHGFVLAIFNWLLFLIFTLFFSKLFYQTFSDTQDLVGQAIDYSNIITGFSCFVFLQVTGEKILQSTGNMILPMISNIADVSRISFWIRSLSSGTLDVRRWSRGRGYRHSYRTVCGNVYRTRFPFL